MEAKASKAIIVPYRLTNTEDQGEDLVLEGESGFLGAEGQA